MSTHAARALCVRAARLRARRHPDSVMETAIAKHVAAQTAMSVAHDAVQVFGGNGCWSQHPVERLFREARVMGIIEGSSEMMQLIVSKFGLDRYRKPGGVSFIAEG